MRIAVFGDSFGYQTPNRPFKSWTDYLAQDNEVFNYCECGVSQYRILQQIRSNIDRHQTDHLIVTHTSATRTFVPFNPLHQHSQTHRHCDIIYADVADRDDEFSRACQQYFKWIFDLDYSMDTHNMICREIDDICKNKKVLHITHFDYTGLYQFPDMINFHDFWLKNKGPVNHYNESGNRFIFEAVEARLTLL